MIPSLSLFTLVERNEALTRVIQMIHPLGAFSSLSQGIRQSTHKSDSNDIFT